MTTPYARHIPDLYELPPKLADLPIWCAWQLIAKPGKKPDKVPVSANPMMLGGKAWSKPDFCATAAQAIRYATANTKLQGIGIILRDESGLAGGDVDRCIDLETGVISDEAQQIITQADTYTEISPGLAGIRFVAFGSFGGHTGNDSSKGVELYESRRFLTITGRHYPGTPTDIEHRDLTELGRAYFGKDEKQTAQEPANIEPPIYWEDGSSATAGGYTLAEIRPWLRNNGADYDTWMIVGAALKKAGGTYLDWVDYSRQSDKHDERDMPKKWASFTDKAKSVGIGTLAKMALDAGMPSREDQRRHDVMQGFTAEPTAPVDTIFTPPARDYVQLPESFKQTELGKLASRISYCIEFPEASTALALLAGASAAVATSYAVQYQSGTPVPAGIYAVIEQPPSMMKSRLLSYAQSAYLKAMGDHNGRIYKHRETLEKDDPKPMPGFSVTTDATSAGLDMELARCSEGRFFIASAEQAAFQSLFPESGDFASHNGLLLQGWAGEYASGMRKGRAAFNGHVSGSVLVIAQPGSSARVFSASNGTGLAERFFYLSEPTPLGSRQHHGEFVTNAQLAPFRHACRECVEDYSKRRFEELELAQDPDRLRQLTFTPDGYRLMLETRRRIEPTLGRLAKDGELVQVGWLGKIETHTMKVAAVLHVVECLANDCNPPAQIPVKMVQTALEFVELLAGHLSGLLHDSGETGEAAEIDAVLELVTRKPYTARPLAQVLRRRHPFRSMGKEAYTRARGRIQTMLEQGRLIVNTKGEIAPG